MSYGKLEAWSLIGRIGHQAASWDTVMTPKMLDNALRAHGVPRDAITKLFGNREDGKTWRESLGPYLNGTISERACRIVRSILMELEEFPDMTIRETMEFAQERKHALRSK